MNAMVETPPRAWTEAVLQALPENRSVCEAY
jgi:hypothetical protein